MSDGETKTDLTSAMLGSSTLTVCTKCGATATYRGSPEKINEAAKDFYELHERCWEHRKEH